MQAPHPLAPASLQSNSSIAIMMLHIRSVHHIKGGGVISIRSTARFFRRFLGLQRLCLLLLFGGCATTERPSGQTLAAIQVPFGEDH